MRVTDTDIEKRFYSKVSKTPTCWWWTGAKRNGQGFYGQIRYEGKPQMAHRVSWKLSKGFLPDHLLICHHCDNGLCVNPDHLFVGTDRDNIYDCISKGRHAKAKLNLGAAVEIRNLFEAGISQRVLRDQFGISSSTISAIVLGKIWKETLKHENR